MPAGYTVSDRETLSYKIHLPDADTIACLFAMTPFYYRCPREGRERAARAEYTDSKGGSGIYGFDLVKFINHLCPAAEAAEYGACYENFLYAYPCITNAQSV